MDLGLSKEAVSKQARTADELNKLGKNQFSKRINEIVQARETIDGISPKYIYILDMHPTKKIIDFYVLAKGVEKVIRMTRDAYKTEGLSVGSVVYCSKFQKENGEYVLSECKVVEKIETEEAVLF